MNRLWKYQDYVDRLSHPSKYVRRWAFFGLNKQFPRRCAPEAAQLIDDPDGILALEAPGCLARGGAVEFAPAILESFLHSSGNRARARAKASGVIRYEAAFEPVVKKMLSGGRMEHLDFLGFVEYPGYTRTGESRAILRRLPAETATRKDLPFNV